MKPPRTTYIARVVSDATFFVMTLVIPKKFYPAQRCVAEAVLGNGAPLRVPIYPPGAAFAPA